MVGGKPWLAGMMSDLVLSENLVLREFRFPDDYAKVIDLWNHAGSGIHVRRSDELAELEKKIQRDPELFLVVEYDDQIIGLCMG